MNLVMRNIEPANIITRNGDTLEKDWPYFDDSDPENTYNPLFVDAVVLNSVEFWTGDSPISSNVGESKIVKNANGEEVTITTNENGYSVSNGETAMNFIFDANDNSWSMEYNNQVNKLISIDGNNAVLYTVNGETMNVTLDAVGVNAARQMFMGSYAMN